MLNEQGGVIDDLIVYRTGEEEFLLIVNAAKIEEDFAWLDSHRGEGISLLNRSDDFAAIAAGAAGSAGFREESLGAPGTAPAIASSSSTMASTSPRRPATPDEMVASRFLPGSQRRHLLG